MLSITNAKIVGNAAEAVQNYGIIGVDMKKVYCDVTNWSFSDASKMWSSLISSNIVFDHFDKRIWLIGYDARFDI